MHLKPYTFQYQAKTTELQRAAQNTCELKLYQNQFYSKNLKEAEKASLQEVNEPA
jgi:hypothetical protein